MLDQEWLRETTFLYFVGPERRARRSPVRCILQSRFRWILKPDNDVFLVLNRGWLRTFDGGYDQTFNRESVKLQYTFRL